METNADNLEINQDELIIQQQRKIEQEVSQQYQLFIKSNEISIIIRVTMKHILCNDFFFQ